MNNSLSTKTKLSFLGYFIVLIVIVIATLIFSNRQQAANNDDPNIVQSDSIVPTTKDGSELPTVGPNEDKTGVIVPIDDKAAETDQAADITGDDLSYPPQ